MMQLLSLSCGSVCRLLRLMLLLFLASALPPSVSATACCAPNELKPLHLRHYVSFALLRCFARRFALGLTLRHPFRLDAPGEFRGLLANRDARMRFFCICAQQKIFGVVSRRPLRM